MKKINIVKISIDILMSVIFVLLFNKMVFNSMAFHEIAGLVIGGVFIIHNVLNIKWIKNVTKNLFSKKLAVKTRVGYIIDVMLLINMVIIIFSGIAISKVLFPNIGLAGNVGLNLKTIHTTVSYATLALVGVHVGLHWSWVMNTVKRVFKIPQNKAFSYAAKAAMALVLAFGLYSCYSTSYFSRAGMITTVFSQQQGPTMEGRPDGMPSNSNENTQQSSGGNGDNNTRQHPDKGGKNGMQQPPNGGGKVAPGGGAENHDKSNPMGSSNPFNVLISYLGVMSVFATGTYYLEKLLVWSKFKKMNKIIIK